MCLRGRFALPAIEVSDWLVTDGRNDWNYELGKYYRLSPPVIRGGVVAGRGGGGGVRELLSAG